MTEAPISSEPSPPDLNGEGIQIPARAAGRRRSSARLKRLLVWCCLAAFFLGVGSGYWLGKRPSQADAGQGSEIQKRARLLLEQINPAQGYTLPVVYGDIGPQLLAAGAIDLGKFVGVYKQSGKPLSEEQLGILTRGSDAPITINTGNANFLLNFFWAFGLTNQNPILSEGPLMARGGKERIGEFASTGGWTIGVKTATELYASLAIVPLNPAQQARLTEVAREVYRPCCDNPTHMPDCNHGMAMLGLLELMASQNATVEEMFTAAKYINAYWFPQQTLEIATMIQVTQKSNFDQADARQVVGARFSSGSGYQAVHQWLAEKDLLEQIPGSGGSCAVQ